MAALRATWSAAKKALLTSGLPTADFPPDFLRDINQGADFGPALDKLEKAKNYPDRRSAIVAVLKAKDDYVRLTQSALKKTTAPGARKALQALYLAILAVWEDAEKMAQPPRPGSATVSSQVLRSINLAGGFKPRYLDVTATKVDVFIEIDKVMSDLIAEGAESLKVAHLGEVALKEIQSVGDAFSATMKDIDAKIGAMAMNQAGRAEKIKEANEVLKHYADIVSDRANLAVQKEWDNYLSRRGYLSAFRVKCVVKIVLGTIGVGVALASAALTFGALWMNVIAAAKGIAEVALTLKTWAKEIDDVYAELFADIEGIAKLNDQRERAKTAGKGQKASKVKESAKEIATALLPFTKPLIKSASDFEARTKQFLGLVSKLESQADKLVKDVNAGLAQIRKMPSTMTAEQSKTVADISGKFAEVVDNIAGIHQRSQNAAKFGDRALKAVQKLRKEDSWIGLDPESTMGCGTKGAALYAAANFAFECAKHGKALIPI